MKNKLTAVEEFTTPNPFTAPTDATIADIQKLMKEKGIRHLPITSANEVVGIVSERDVKLTLGLSTEFKTKIRAEDIMKTDPVTVNASDSIDQVAFLMSDKKIGSVLVYDSDGFLGIFTATDALNALIEIVQDLKKN